MSSHKATENSDSVSLFPFLAVLLCTMGALLVLLVVLVDRAAKRQAELQHSPTVALARAELPGLETAPEALQLRAELDQLEAYQRKLDELREEGTQRLKNERLRLSHAEERTRRLEEELAKLAIAAQQLEQAAKNQEIDQEQAAVEMARLEKLVKETAAQNEKLREEAHGKKSYAIIPYKGPNGTRRQPIYIECDQTGVVIQPEGLRLTVNDFVATSWPGNPLASLLRASREYLNEKASQAGEPEPPDPYPLLIVRPSGIKQYALARAAITSWDSDYGYEFIEEDTPLSYPSLPDPILAQAQNHAVMIARERLVQMAQAAPRRFRGTGLAGGLATGFDDSSLGGDGTSSGELKSDAPSGKGTGSAVADSLAPGGAASPGRNSAGGTTGEMAAGSPSSPAHSAAGGEAPFGKSTTGVQKGGVAHGDSTSPSAEEAGDGMAGSDNTSDAVGPRYAQASGGAAAGSNGSTPGISSSATASGLITSDQNGMKISQSINATTGGAQSLQSIAQTHGKNWAVDRKADRAIPIRRAIVADVRPHQVALLPEGYDRSHRAETGKTISLDQPLEEISKEFTGSLRERIEQWGLAGSGMYWKPVLEIHVGSDAQNSAAQLLRLLEDSGVEIKLPDLSRHVPEVSNESGRALK